MYSTRRPIQDEKDLSVLEDLSYALDDIDNGVKYIGERTKLLLFNVIYKKIPNILSECKIHLGQASYEDDYYYSQKFKNRAILVDIELTQKSCELLRCNYAKPDGACQPHDEESYYNVGDNQIDTQCQPACYSMFDKIDYDEKTGDAKVQSVDVIWNNDTCVIKPNISQWMELPRFRADPIFVNRLNNMDIGFNRTPNAFSATGVSYTYNKAYCEVFGKKFDSENEVCKTTIIGIIIGAIVSEQLVKLTQSTMPDKDGKIRPSYEIPKLPTQPSITKTKWLQYNDDFVTPNPDMNVSDIPAYIQSNRRNVVYTKHDKKINKRFDKLFKRIKLSGNERREMERLHNEMKKRTQSQRNINNEEQDPPPPSTAEALLEKIQMILLGISGMFFDPEFWRDLVLSEAADLIGVLLKKLTKQLIKKLPSLIASVSSSILTNVFKVAITATFKSMIKQVVKNVIVKNLLKVVALCSTVIGIILAILMVLDILFALWDPFGYNNEFPPTIFKDITENAEKELRITLDTPTPKITFDFIISMMLSEEEITENMLESFMWLYEYFDSLDVNAYGSVIYKGQPLFGDEKLNDTELDKLNVKMTMYSQPEFMRNEQALIERTNILENNTLIYACMGIIVLALVTQIIPVVIILLFVLCILIFLKFYNMNNKNLIQSDMLTGIKQYLA